MRRKEDADPVGHRQMTVDAEENNDEVKRLAEDRNTCRKMTHQPFDCREMNKNWSSMSLAASFFSKDDKIAIDDKGPK